MREWKFYITGSIYADTLGETTADIEDAKAIGRCFVIKSNGNAAKMRERAYAVIAKARKANETQTSFGCRTCVENYIKEINYIRHGDAWKEEK